MGMAEIRDAFEAYAAGALAEYELRNALREEVTTQPDAVPRYVAMAAALRRRNLISAELEAVVVSDLHATTEQASVESKTTRATTGSVVADAIANSNTRAAARSQPRIAPTFTDDEPQPQQPAAEIGKAAGWDSKEALSEPEALLCAGHVLRERFQLVEELGRGGMGVVYKALDQREIENRGREPYVAIKVLNEEFKRHPESARALQRETKKSMRLAHPNIVLVRDFDRDRGNVYMVMELLHGQPLDQLVLNGYPRGMPVEKVVAILSGLGAALSYAHQQGIVHADFKPSNAFLTTQNIVKVLDFGVARVALALDRGDSTLFDAGKLNAVSPAYASIELLVGEAPDVRDDIYALACVTYFLLTGRHPFNGTDAIKAREAQMQPAPIEGLADHKWRALRAALVFERYRRTATVREFVSQFCTDRTTRTEKITTTVTKAVDAAIERPWLSAVPVSVLLAAGAAVLLWRQWPVHHSAPAATVVAAPVVAEAAPAPASEHLSPGELLEQHFGAVDARSPEFLDNVVAGAADARKIVASARADEAVHRFQAAVQLALSRRVDGLLEHDDATGARKLVARLSELLPAGTAKLFSPDTLAKRQALIALKNAPAPTQHWADQLSAAIQALSGTAMADDPLLRDARDASDKLFKGAASDASSHQGMDEARELLAMGLSVDPQSPDLTRAALELANSTTQPVINTAASSSNQGAANPQTGTPVAKAPAAPHAVAAVPTTVAAPASAAPAATAPTPAPVVSGADSYVQHAKQQMASGDTAAALETIIAARRKFASSAQLKNLEITYDRIEEEVERINSAPSLNVTDHQQWIAEIRSLAGEEDFPAIEQMLAQTLANDIADQRARGDRPSVVQSLLTSGRKLFPEYAATLEHGIANVLDPKQTAMAEEPSTSTAGAPGQK